MKKLSFYITLLLSVFLINITETNCITMPLSKYGNGAYKGINWGFAESHGLPSHIYSTVSINGTVNVKAKLEGQDIILNDIPNVLIKLNNKITGYCINATKAAPVYQRLRPVYRNPITNDFVNYVYGWAESGSSGNYTAEEKRIIAEQIFFALGEVNYFGTNSVSLNGGQISYVDFRSNNIINSRESFTVKIGNYLQAGTTGTSANEFAKYILPKGYLLEVDQFYQCLKSKNFNNPYCRLIKASIEQSKIGSMEKNEKCEIEINIHKDGVPDFNYCYTKDDLENDSLNIEKLRKATRSRENCVESLCSTIQNATAKAQCENACKNDDDWINGAVNAIINDKASEGTYDSFVLYEDIMRSTPEKLMVYAVVDKDGNSIGEYQKIISKEPNKIPQKSCSDYVAALRELGYSDDDIWSIKGVIDKAAAGNLLKNEATGEVKCSDRQSECVSTRTSWYRVIRGWRYVGYSPKIGSLYAPIYTPKYETINTGTDCECDIETKKFSGTLPSTEPIYKATCAEFKNWYQNIAKIGPMSQIASCDDAAHTASCGTTVIGYTCDSLIGQYGGDRRTASDRDNLNSRITDPNGVKAILIDPDGDGFGTLKCQPPCDPTVNADNGVCHLKELSKPWFRLSDAELPSGGENMSCILENIAYNVESDIITSKDTEFSKSAYCDVYCWESLYALFPFEPSAAGYVETGRLFFWGTDYSKREFANIGVQRICWSKNINYEQFKTDWNNNEAAIAKAKTAYDNQVSYNAKSGWDSTEACKYDCVSTSSTETVSCGNYNQHGNCGANDCYWDGSCWKRDKSSETCKDGTRYKRGAVGSGDTASTSYDKCLGSAPNESDIDNSSEEASRKSTLEGLIKKRQSLKNAIMGCQSKEIINENSIYKHTATIKLEDEDHLGLCNARGVCNDDLSLKLNIENANVDISSNTIASYFNVSCTDVGSFNVSNPCAVDGGTTIPTYPNSEYRWDYTANESFRYSDNFYFYAQADTDFVANKSMVTEKFNKEKADMYGLTYDMGAGIPTFIEKYSGQFKLNVKVSNLGNDSHFDKILQNGDKYGYDFQKYSCPYDLAKIIPIYCPPSDPNYPCHGKRSFSVVYRIIDMAAGDKAKVFPGNTGENALQTVNGRRIGSNWASFANTEKFKKITTQDEIYGKKPLYSIELSPTLINEIRRDNNSYRDEKMDPYTSYKDTSNNYKITCTPGNDKSCTSKYITELIQKGKITGRFAEENEEQRRNLIKNYK